MKLVCTALLFSALARGAAAAEDTSADNVTCFLLKDHQAGAGQFDFTYKEPTKPFPSLTQCYKNNQGACCVSAHDAYIESQYAEILSTTCLRQFPYLEQYYCLGCNPDQGKWVVGNEYTYTTGTDGEVEWTFDLRICRSFMDFLYMPDDEAYNYDKCGLLDGGVGYLPTSRFVNSSQFINQIKPPYFSHVNWVEINDVTDSSGTAFADDVECYVPGEGVDADPSSYECCFSSASGVHASAWVAAASVALVVTAWLR